MLFPMNGPVKFNCARISASRSSGNSRSPIVFQTAIDRRRTHRSWAGSALLRPKAQGILETLGVHTAPHQRRTDAASVQKYPSHLNRIDSGYDGWRRPAITTVDGLLELNRSQSGGSNEEN